MSATRLDAWSAPRRVRDLRQRHRLEPVEEALDHGTDAEERDQQEHEEGGELPGQAPHASIPPLVLFEVASQERVEDSGQHGAQDRCDPEQPELAERPAADEDRGAGAARGVDREVRDGDPDQVDQREPEADRDRREARRGAWSVAPRMITRNMNVSTTSVTSAEASGYRPGECSA